MKSNIIRKGYAPTIATLALTLAFTTGCSKKCGDEEYNSKTHFCADNKIHEKCGKDGFDPETQFCYADKVIEKCGGRDYNPDVLYCKDNEICGKCGDKDYRSYQFCYNDSEVIEKCNGIYEYDPEKQFCYNSNEVADKCGGKEFNPNENYCYEEKIKKYSKCYEKDFKAETHFCAKDSTVWELCGGKKFDIEFKICVDGKITNPECNGNKFNAAAYSCLNGVLIVDNNEPFDFPQRTEYEADYVDYGDCGACGECENGEDIYESWQSCCWTGDVSGYLYDNRKAFCTHVRYILPRDPMNQAPIYKKCGGKEYDPYIQACIKGKLLDFNCDYKGFSVELGKFCVNDKMYDACLVKDDPNSDYSHGQYFLYNPKKEGCCGNLGVYSFSTYFCNGNGELEIACGGKEYNLDEQFCYNEKVYEKCGNVGEYNPETHSCKDGALNIIFVSGKLNDSRDSKTYKTVKIGKQTWMAENLNIDVAGSLCYDDKPENCAKYGRLYNWETAKSACPAGWHLPVREDWNVLEDIVGERINGESTAGKALKSKTSWVGDDANGTNNIEFSALPSGYKEGDDFKNIGTRSFWWTSENCGPSMACSRMMSSENKDVIMAFMYEWFYGSVRCVKDN